jgi:sec-independent protein translocase protein TatA
MGRLGWGEILLILLVVLLLFGATRLPQLGRSLGEGIKNLKKGLSGSDDDAASKDEGAAKNDKIS